MKASTRPSIEEGFAFSKYLFETAAYPIMAIHHSQNGSKTLITHHFVIFIKNTPMPGQRHGPFIVPSSPMILKTKRSV